MNNKTDVLLEIMRQKFPQAARKGEKGENAFKFSFLLQLLIWRYSVPLSELEEFFSQRADLFEQLVQQFSAFKNESNWALWLISVDSEITKQAKSLFEK